MICRTFLAGIGNACFRTVRFFAPVAAKAHQALLLKAAFGLKPLTADQRRDLLPSACCTSPQYGAETSVQSAPGE
jgi:hypothetical protein